MLSGDTLTETTTMEVNAQPLVRLLTDRDVSAVTGAARSTLAKMRLRGGGPPFVRLGTSVRYPEDALREWLVALPLRRSTSDATANG
jgi:predicted DNA-binding transcriptional regulator AlpA